MPVSMWLFDNILFLYTIVTDNFFLALLSLLNLLSILFGLNPVYNKDLTIKKKK